MKKVAVPAAGPENKNLEALARAKKRRSIAENIELWGFALPGMALLFVFHYVPLYGIVIAFQDYYPGNPFLSVDSNWIGLKHFTDFIKSVYFGRLIRNSIRLSLLNLMFGFWMPIIFALILNEIRCMWYKKFVQTASYLPYFISSVVVAGMAISFLQPTGIINTFLNKLFGIPPTSWLDVASKFPLIYTVINVWKGFGFGSVLYFSTISSIDPGLYESARMDGANRWSQMWHITLPGLRFIICIQFIMALGGILGANSDLIILIYSAAVYETADVIGSYTYRVGVVGGKYSYTTAVGLFMSIIGFTLTFLANKVSNLVTGFGLW